MRFRSIVPVVVAAAVWGAPVGALRAQEVDPAAELKQVQSRIAKLEAELAALRKRAASLEATLSRGGAQEYLARRKRVLIAELAAYEKQLEVGKTERIRGYRRLVIDRNRAELKRIEAATDEAGRTRYFRQRHDALALFLRRYRRMDARRRPAGVGEQLTDELREVSGFLGVDAEASIAATAPDAEAAESAAAKGNASVPRAKLLWKTPTKSDSKGSGAIADIDGDGELEIVFGTYFNDRHLYALSAKTGEVEWTFESDRGPLDASVAIDDLDGDGTLEILAADSSSGNLFCVNGKGEEQWRLKLPNSTDSPPAIADLDGDGSKEIIVGSMWLGDRNGRVGVYRAKDRTLVWEQKVPGCVQSAPCLVHLDDDKILDVIVTSWRGDRGVHAFSGRDGAPLWRFETAGTDKSMGMYHGPALVAGNQRHIVIATCDGDVYALDRKGEQVWHHRLTAEYLFAPVTVADIDGDQREEAIVCGRRAVYVFDAATGKRGWKRPVSASVGRGAVIADADGDGDPDVIICAGTELRAFDGKRGNEVLRYDAKRKKGGDQWEKISSAPVIADFDGDGKLDVFFVCGRGVYGRGGKMKDGNYGWAIALRLRGKKGAWATFRGNLHRTGRPEAGPR